MVQVKTTGINSLRFFCLHKFNIPKVRIIKSEFLSSAGACKGKCGECGA